jgi:hypothetical protein
MFELFIASLQSIRPTDPCKSILQKLVENRDQFFQMSPILYGQYLCCALIIAVIPPTDGEMNTPLTSTEFVISLFSVVFENLRVPANLTTSLTIMKNPLQSIAFSITRNMKTLIFEAFLPQIDYIFKFINKVFTQAFQNHFWISFTRFVQFFLCLWVIL